MDEKCEGSKRESKDPDSPFNLRCMYLERDTNQLQTSLNEEEVQVKDGKSEDDAETDASVNSCFSCKRTAHDLLKCSNCKVAVYCGHTCQKENWSLHKKVCGKISSNERCATAKDLPSDDYTKEDRKETREDTGSCFFCKREKSAWICSSVGSVKLPCTCNRFCQKNDWPEHKLKCSGQGKKAASDCQRSRSAKNQKQFGEYTQNERPPWEYAPCLSCKLPNEQLMRCTKCRVARYCSRDCQQKHWSDHKDACKRYVKHVSSGTAHPNNGRVDHRGTHSLKLCQNCKKAGENFLTCVKCEHTNYCSVTCQIKHSEEHSLECENLPQFFKALRTTSDFLAELHTCIATKFVLPPLRFFGVLNLYFDSQAVLLEIGDTFHHPIRHGVFVKDMTGKMVHMLFYHNREEEQGLAPFTLSQRLAKGNFIRWFYPRWRLFLDKKYGFRIDSLDELEFIERPLDFRFPKF